MTKKILFVDFENVQEIGDLSKIPGSFHVMVFIGAHQKKLSADLVMKNQKLGSRLEWKQVDGHGKNALDFYIAYELGSVLEKNPLRECIIFSKDAGFDPLLAGLAKDGKNCKRVESLQEILK